VIYCRPCAAVQQKRRRAGALVAVFAGGGVAAFSALHATEPATETAPPLTYHTETTLRLDAVPASVRALALSPDGKTLASASESGQVSLWDARTGARLASAEVSDTPLSALAFSAGRLVAAGDDGSPYFYEVPSLRPVVPGERYIRGHVSAITGLASVPGSDLVVSVGADGLAILWDAKQARMLRSVDALERGLLAVAVSPGGDRIAVAGKPGSDGTAQVVLYETAARLAPAPAPAGAGLAEGNELGRLAYPAPAGGEQAPTGGEVHQKIATLKVSDPSVTALAFSPDGTRLAMAGIREGVRERDLSTNTERLIARGVSSYALSYTPDGTLAIASQDGRLLFAAQAALTAFSPLASPVLGLGSPNPAREAAPSATPAPASASGASAPPALTEIRQPAPLRALALGREQLYFAGDAPSIWTSPLQKPGPSPLVEKAHSGRAHDLALLPDGSALVASSSGVYRYTAGPAPTLSAHYPSGDTSSVSASRDGLYLGLVSDCAARCWVDLTRGLNEEAAGALTARLKESGISAQQERSPGGVTLRVLGVDKERADFALAGIGLVAPAFQERGAFSFATDQEDGLRLDTGGVGVTDIAFSPRALLVAASLADGRVKLFSPGDPQATATLEGVNKTPLQTLFSPEGTILAVAHRSGEVVLWDTASRARLRSVYAFNGTPTEPRALAFSPDGKFLVIANQAAEIMRFEVSTGDKRGERRVTAPVGALAISPTGEVIAASTNEGELLFLGGDASSERGRATIAGEVSALSFGSEGRLYAAGFFPKEGASLLSFTLRAH
jgi:WD40 repeat protein